MEKDVQKIVLVELDNERTSQYFRWQDV